MNKKFHILHIIGCLIGGGAETIMQTLCRKQREQGHDISIVYLHDFPGTAAVSAELQAKGCRIMRLKLSNFSSILRILAWARAVDIIHTHLIMSEIYGLVLSMIFRKKLVLHRYLPRFTRLRRFFLNQITVRRAAAVICISRCVKQFVAGTCRTTAHKCRVVYPGLDEREAHSRLTDFDVKAHFADGKKYYALIPARLDQQKGLIFLLKAVKSARVELKDWIFLFAGTGPLKNELETFISRNDLTDLIRLIGFKKNIYDFISKADLIILPSFYEGLGMVLLEAMCFGKAMIAADIDAIREAAGGAALLVDPGNVSQLKNALLKMRCDDFRNGYALRSKQGANNFTASAMAQEVDNVYNSISC